MKEKLEEEGNEKKQMRERNGLQKRVKWCCVINCNQKHI